MHQPMEQLDEIVSSITSSSSSNSSDMNQGEEEETYFINIWIIGSLELNNWLFYFFLDGGKMLETTSQEDGSIHTIYKITNQEQVEHIQSLFTSMGWILSFYLYWKHIIIYSFQGVILID